MPKFKTADEVAELAEIVDMAMDKCTAANLPAVCEMAATPSGRATVREALMRYCVEGDMSPGSALLALEREYTFTTLD